MEFKNIFFIILVPFAVIALWLAFEPSLEGNVSMVMGQALRHITVSRSGEGFGVTTPGGRYGKVYRVKSLADSGPGSLREALQASGPRMIVFDVAGIIQLKEYLVIAQPFVTVSGQSAPSPGITLWGAGLRIQTHDVVLQHFRVRVGDDPAGPSPQSRDGLQLVGASAYNIVADRLSVSWAIDENVSVTQGAHDITISNSIISEALNLSLHPKGEHSMGILVGEGSSRIALIRNVLAHNGERNPRIKGGSAVVAVNNLVFNCRNKAFVVVGSSDGPSQVSLVGNVFLPGPDSPEDVQLIHLTGSDGGLSRIYSQDNLLEGYPDRNYVSDMIGSPPVWHPSIKVISALEVEELLLERAGARPWERDLVDRRIIREVGNRSGRIINSQKVVDGWSL